MESTYRVVFKGQILPGFDLASVKQTASVRLKASPAQVEQLFGGRVVVLKKGVSQDMGNRYAAELASMGLDAKVEAENAAATAAAPTLAPTVTSPAGSQPSAPVKEIVTPDTTHPVSPSTAQGAARHTPADATVLVAHPSSAMSSAPTGAADPTMQVSLPQGQGGTPHTPAEVKSFDAERTLIASAETLAEYFSANAEPSKPAPDASASAPAPEKAPVEHEGVICPACGKTQRRRGICRSCGHDMTAPPAPTDEPALLEASGAQAKAWEHREPPRPGGGAEKTELVDIPMRRSSSDTTVFVPRKGSSDATVLVPLGGSASTRNTATDDGLDEFEDEQPIKYKASHSKAILLTALVLALAAAAAYYFLYS